MSCVAEANAAMINSTSVSVNILIGVAPDAMVATSGFGNVMVKITISAVISTCMPTIHQRLVFTTSTIGPHKPFKNHGK